MTTLNELYTSDLWKHNKNSIWLASSLKLFRNLEKFHFPNKLDDDQREQVLSILHQQAANCTEIDTPFCYTSEKLSAQDKEFVMEHFLTTEGLQRTRRGEGIVTDKTGRFTSFLNTRNHMLLHLLETGEELEAALKKLTEIETALSDTLHFSFHPKFGFLSADPEHCGTSLLIQGFLQVPALSRSDQLGEIVKRCEEEGLTLFGLQGSPDEFIGDIMVIQNQRTVGVSEEDIVKIIRSQITKIVIDEQALRREHKNDETPHMKDCVSRAYGLLTHSYHLETVEALNNLSLVKLGVDLGWITDIPIEKMNELTFYCRRAHLNTFSDEEDISKARAKYIKNALEQTTLNI